MGGYVLGLTVPLMASATGTFLFRQFFQTLPDSLAEAAQLDGAGPMRFLWSFVLPLSRANIAALFVILFVYGWNEYLWPLLITNRPEMRTAVIGIEALVPRSGSQLPEWNVIMAAATMVLLPPVAIIVFMQRWFVKGSWRPKSEDGANHDLDTRTPCRRERAGPGANGARDAPRRAPGRLAPLAGKQPARLPERARPWRGLHRVRRASLP
jgi:ABC-type Fe3+ transport system permease subunit